MSTYIKLSDVQKIINNNKFTEHKTALLYFDDVVQKINSLPSISFEEMIKEMIEDIDTKYNALHSYTDEGKGWVRGNKNALQELLNKLHK